MPRPSKGPRLYFRQGRLHARTGRPLADVWVIRDGSREISTGCGYAELAGPGGAETQLSAYLVEKTTTAPARGSASEPGDVLVAEVLAFYAADRGPELNLDAHSLAGFVKQLLAWWGDMTVADVKRSNCKAYAEHRTSMPNASYTKDPANAPRVSVGTARRELEILGGAIGHWDGEHKLKSRPDVWLPEKPESQRDALTRSQAAALLWAAMGWRRDPKTGRWKRLQASSIANRRHLRRFVLIGLYTGTRHSAMRAMLWEESATQAWVDLDRRMIYRRGREEKDHKTKRRPVVKIPRRLAAHMRRWRRLDLELEARRRESDPDFRLNSVLHHGGESLAGKIRTGFEGIVRDSCLPADVTPHWMRHTAATWLMEGVKLPGDLKKAADFLGMSIPVLIGHYGHVMPDYQDDIGEMFGVKKAVSGDQSGHREKA